MNDLTQGLCRLEYDLTQSLPRLAYCVVVVALAASSKPLPTSSNGVGSDIRKRLQPHDHDIWKNKWDSGGHEKCDSTYH